MTNNIMLNETFASILSDMGVNSPVDRIKIDGLMDTPGHHWSNPGVKQISVNAGGEEYRFVLKTLAEHSKREIKVYRFLTGVEDYPIPRMYHSVYSEETREYWMIIERCMERDFLSPEDFWKECGILLARIHSEFWNKTENLPSCFNLEPKTGRLHAAVQRLSEFLDSLSGNNLTLLETDLNTSLTDLKACLEETVKENLVDLPTPARCLLHGSFHSPEIMWRETPDGFTPMGVDWEGCRIGNPAEDLSFAVQNLLPKGEEILFDTFMEAYFNELATFYIQPDRNSILATTKQEALIKTTGSVVPFLLQTYLEVRKDESFKKWGEWLKESFPCTVHYAINVIASGEIYAIGK